ncbi:unnamed protein product, partial [Staurois parvus]
MGPMSCQSAPVSKWSVCPCCLIIGINGRNRTS